MVNIIPSLLVSTEDEFRSQIAAVQSAIDMVQIDIADGNFVPNTTWYSPEIASQILEVDCELHLMVSDPVSVAAEWRDVAQVKRVLFHYEAVEDVRSTVESLEEFGWEIGLVLNPETDVSVVDEYISDLDVVMFMGVIPGKQGQPFVAETPERISKLIQKYPGLYVSLDGAVNSETLPLIIPTGLTAACPGSAIFHSDSVPVEAVADMRKLIKSLQSEV